MQPHSREMPRGARRASPRSLLRAGLRPGAAAGCAAPGACAARFRHRWPESARPPRAGRRPSRPPGPLPEADPKCPQCAPGAGAASLALPAPTRGRRMVPGPPACGRPMPAPVAGKPGRASRGGRRVRAGAGSRGRAVRARAPRGTRLFLHPGQARERTVRIRALASPRPRPLAAPSRAPSRGIGNFF